MSEPSFPPLFQGLALGPGSDPMAKACSEAMRGCDAGLVTYHLGPNRLDAAIVFAPDVPLQDAMGMLPVCGIGFQNALGALAPPEVAVHLDWDGGLRVNGAACGRLTVAASDDDPEAEPAWLVVGLTLPLWPESDDPGHTPDQTTLYAEGCAEVEADRLLESWVKHTLVGINRFSEGDVAGVHRDWRELAHGIGEDADVAGHAGVFLGVDERFGMLIRTGNETHLVPLTHLLEDSP